MNELEVLNAVIDSIEKQPDRARKIATLRCFVRSLRQQDVLETDVALLDLPKDIMVMPTDIGEA